MRSLVWKLTLAFLLVALTVALLVAVSLRLTSADQLDQLIIDQRRSEFKTQLANYYAANGSWAGVEVYFTQYHRGPQPQATPPQENQPGGQRRPPDIRRDRRELFGAADAQGRILIPLWPDFPANASVMPAVLAQGEPILVNDEVVGTVLTAEGRPGLNPEETAYLQRTTTALLLASVGAVLVALLVGVWLARTLTQPLRALTDATHRMAGGALEQEVLVKSADELGELTAAFNQMSRQVARANHARKQMTADVAHELRTPLTVIAGYVEAMRDGVLTASPERLTVIYSEIERLQHLVGDLRTLSQADAGELKLNVQRVAPGEFLSQAVATFEHQATQKDVTLAVQLANGLPALSVDEIRLGQVLSNLISNALRYTPSGGTITLGAVAEGPHVTLTVADTGPGIAPEDVPRIFDRLYRADKARAENNGESGLGLAIAKALVEAHGGTIEVQSELGRGTTLILKLPAA
ncbi:MAG: ATP-binding protein [Anaerolineales bacterium]